LSLLLSNDTDHDIIERELDIKDSTESQLDENPIEKSLESLFEKVTSPTRTGHQSDLARFNNNTLLYFSPQTKTLHSDILGERRWSTLSQEWVPVVECQLGRNKINDKLRKLFIHSPKQVVIG
jgi:hypothetical protein